MTRREKRELVERLNRDAERIAGRFGLRYRSIEAERANVKRRYGVCYSDGSIKIRLNHVTTGRPLRYSSLVNTLCHELAHLRHFNHGPAFKAFYLEMLAWARQQRIYRPVEAGARLRPRTPGPGWPEGSPRGIPRRERPEVDRPAAPPRGQLDLFRDGISGEAGERRAGGGAKP